MRQKAFANQWIEKDFFIEVIGLNAKASADLFIRQRLHLVLRGH
jgi:hypothetical protein